MSIGDALHKSMVTAYMVSTDLRTRTGTLKMLATAKDDSVVRTLSCGELHDVLLQDLTDFRSLVQRYRVPRRSGSTFNL